MNFYNIFTEMFQLEISILQGFIQDKIGSKIEPFTKTGDLKTDPSQKSETLKRTLKLKITM